MRTRPTGSSPREQRQKYEAHKAANGAVKQLRATGQHFTAFVVAFALLEDRVHALDYVARDLALIPPVKNKRAMRDWKAIVNRLCDGGMLEKPQRTELLNLASIRNRVVHSAIYNLTAVTDRHVGKVMESRKSIDSKVRKLMKNR